MSEELPVQIDVAGIAAAFPTKHLTVATAAGTEVVRHLDSRYWWGQFKANVEGDAVLIPVRLHFASQAQILPESDRAWLFARALQTRSTDGFERQCAMRDLLQHRDAWASPFIISLIGEYVVEILDDISEALSPEMEQILGVFIADNKALWETTKHRVTSYWDVYYRGRYGSRPGHVYSREDYVGFKIVDRLSAAASMQVGAASQ
jgi:hypothetical protein